MNEIKFILTILISLVFTFTLYVYLILYQFGAPVEAEWWASDLYNFKMSLIRSEKRRKVVLIGGSNILFGINSKILSDKLKLPVYNLGVHFIMYKLDLVSLDEVLNENDIVIAGYEPDLYFLKDELNDWFVNNMLAWGKDIYIDKLSLSSKFQALFSIKPKRVFKGVISKLEHDLSFNKTSNLSEMTSFIYSKDLRDTTFYGYSYKSLNKNGDFIVNSKEFANDNLSSINLFNDNESGVSSQSILFLKTLSELVRRKKAHLVLTYSAMLKTKKFNKYSVSAVEKMNKFSAFMKKFNFIYYCDPFEFTYPRKYFLDSKYHLNEFGSKLRTKKLIDCLSQQSTFNFLNVSINDE